MSKKFIAVIFLMAFIFTSCSGSGNSGKLEAPKEVYEAANTMAAAADTTSSAMQDFDYGDVASNQSSSSQVISQNSENNNPSLKIIKNGGLSVETKEINKTVQTITDRIVQSNGYVQSLNSSKNRVEIVARIPSANFDAFMNGSSDFGNIVNKNIYTEDVSETYFDSDARIKSLKVQEGRLLDILAKGQELKYLLEVEKELARVRTEIELLEGKLRNLDNRISYSTINININETPSYTMVEETPKNFGERIAKAFLEGISVASSFIGNLIISLIYFFPIGLLIALVAFLVWKIVKRFKPKYNSPKFNINKKVENYEVNKGNEVDKDNEVDKK